MRYLLCLFLLTGCTKVVRTSEPTVTKMLYYVTCMEGFARSMTSDIPMTDSEAESCAMYLMDAYRSYQERK